ncbi:carbohydrate sulfotransferase 11-like [Ptychodera flava]|uniref:carbohydrate sulfotransferase 11-like n=1 Tax=Ptychodera flava TaxID=63121 RepID=UPI003969C5B2
MAYRRTVFFVSLCGVVAILSLAQYYGGIFPVSFDVTSLKGFHSQVDQDVAVQRGNLQEINDVTKSNTKVTASLSDEGKPDMEKIQKRRLHTLTKACNKMKNSKYYHKPNLFHKYGLIYDSKHQLLYCPVPKTGATSWKRVFLVLRGTYRTTEGLHHSLVQHEYRYPTLNSVEAKRRTKMYSSYTKIIFARHPLQRILSAYRNKLERANGSFKRYGTSIVARYRHNASNIPATGRYVAPTFHEFVKYLLDPTNQAHLNRHWGFMHQMCAVCETYYDFIGHFENLQEEANYIIHKTAGNEFSYPGYSTHVTNSSHTDIYMNYFSEIPDHDIVQLYNKFKMDFEVFGYSFPHELLRTEQTNEIH